MNLIVVGTGYVGLMTGAGFAARGHSVVCVDNDAAKVDSLKRGIIPWYEPGLPELVRKCVDAKRLSFTAVLPEKLTGVDIIFIAVGTPPSEDGSADTSAVFAAVGEVGRALVTPATLVIRSTVPVGTANRVRASITQRTNVRCHVVSNPEFLRESRAVEDFSNPARVVIGADSLVEAFPLRDLYASFVPQDKILIIDTRSAEMSKYASNAFLATKISFANEIANLCEALGADVEHVRKVMGLDPRIGSAHLAAGLGYGGSCLPKDTLATLRMGSDSGVSLDLVSAAQRINDERPDRLVDLLLDLFDGDIRGRRIALWGLAFKPETDDLRGAPSVKVIERLESLGASIVAYDPSGVSSPPQLKHCSLDYATDQYECLEGAEALLLITEWEQFRQADWSKAAGLMKSANLFDGRNVLDPRFMATRGFTYRSLGRGSASPIAPSPTAYREASVAP